MWLVWTWAIVAGEWWVHRRRRVAPPEIAASSTP
jgi:hypothetical protein